MTVPELSGVDWPAWVQAVGSVLAIVAAIWIDQGNARRQAAQLDHAELLRKQERAEFALSMLGQALYVLTWGERTLQDLAALEDRRRAWAIYRKWEGVAQVHIDALQMLTERIPQPDLLIHALRFVRNARPAAPESHDVTPEALLEERVAGMRFAMSGLEGCVQGIAADANVSERFSMVAPMEGAR